MRISDWSSDVCSSDLLVVFRDTDGRVGVMDEYCPHRRVSLVYGRNEECGLRCLYHGWKMDVEGTVIEMVRSEEHTSELQSLMRISYAVFCLKKKKQQQTDSTNTSNRHYTQKTV